MDNRPIPISDLDINNYRATLCRKARRERATRLRKHCDKIIKQINQLGPEDEMINLPKAFAGYETKEYSEELMRQRSKIKRFKKDDQSTGLDQTPIHS